MNKMLNVLSCCFMIGLFAISISTAALAHGPGQGGDLGHRPPDMIQHVTKSLADLVDNGTITPEQSDKILAFFKEKDDRIKADCEKTKDMSPEERKAYFDQRRPKDRPDIVKDLMNCAGLSEDQAKKVADALRPPMPPPGCEPSKR